MPSALLPLLKRSLPLVAVALLAGCTIAPPRTDDPYEKFNRSMYAFNDKVDKAVVRPVAVGYRKVTNPPVRRSINNFYTNLRRPITVANDLLQVRPLSAFESTGRFVVNLTLGIGGFFDPASRMGIPLQETDFGITLARWGLPEGGYLVLPLMGPSTVRDVWKIPVDGYFFDPLSYYQRNHSYEYGQEYLPEVLYFVTLRDRGLDAESFLNSAYDPYAFLRDAYRQTRLYQLYDGNPPTEIIEQMQGLKEKNFNPDELLEEQQNWENQQKPAEKPVEKPAEKPQEEQKH